MRRIRNRTIASLAGRLAVACALGAVATSAGVAAPVVTDVSIDLRLRPELGIFEQTTEIAIEGDGDSRLEFRIDPNLTVESVRAPGGFADFRKAGRRLLVDLDRELDGRRTLRFRITGRPRRGAADTVTDRYAILAGDDAWYPRYARERARATVRVRVPGGWTAIGPGESRGTDEIDGERVWKWSASRPVRTVTVAAAPELALSEATAARHRVRVAAPEATGEESTDAESVAAAVADPLVWFSGALLPYPYDGLNVARIPGAPFGGRGSGVVVLTEAIPLAAREDGAAAVAGQWWGEIVAGDGAWMRAFAAWQAAVYARDRSRPVPHTIAEGRAAYLDLDPTRDVPIAKADASTPDAVLVGKGSAAPAMVLEAIGSRAFYRGVGDLFAGAGVEPIGLTEVRGAIEEYAGTAVRRPFAEWFERRGVPRLTATLRTTAAGSGGYRADVRIEQSGTPFTLSIRIVLVGAEVEKVETLRIEGDRTEVYYLLPFRPARLEVDPLGVVFGHPIEIRDPASRRRASSDVGRPHTRSAPGWLFTHDSCYSAAAGRQAEPPVRESC